MWVVRNRPLAVACVCGRGEVESHLGAVCVPHGPCELAPCCVVLCMCCEAPGPDLVAHGKGMRVAAWGFGGLLGWFGVFCFSSSRGSPAKAVPRPSASLPCLPPPLVTPPLRQLLPCIRLCTRFSDVRQRPVTACGCFCVHHNVCLLAQASRALPGPLPSSPSPFMASPVTTPPSGPTCSRRRCVGCLS